MGLDIYTQVSHSTLMSELPPIIKDDYRPPSADPVFNVQFAPTRISESATCAENSFASFQAMMLHMEKATKLTGLELIDEVETFVDRFRAVSYEHALLGELVRRYEKVAGIERPSEDFTDPTSEELAEIDRIDAEIEAERDKVLYYVIRFEDGTFYCRDTAPTSTHSLLDATRYPNRESAQEIAQTDATVIEVTT